VSPEDRAKAIVEHFAASLPPAVRPELERAVTSAIKRALGQQLAELEAWAEASAEHAHGRGKSGKGQDVAAIRVHDDWARRFRRMRNGEIVPQRPKPPRARLLHEGAGQDQRGDLQGH